MCTTSDTRVGAALNLDERPIYGGPTKAGDRRIPLMDHRRALWNGDLARQGRTSSTPVYRTRSEVRNDLQRISQQVLCRLPQCPLQKVG